MASSANPINKRHEGRRSAIVIRFPSAIDTPVQNVRVYGPKPKGVVSINSERHKRERHARAAARQRAAEVAYADACAVVTRYVPDRAARRVPTAQDSSVIAHALAILEQAIAAKGDVFTDHSDVKAWACLKLGALDFEQFGVMYLDAQHAAIAFEPMFRGTLTQVSVYPREVVRQAMAHNASAVLLFHNHPSGSPTPSRADVDLTKTLKAVLALVDVQVLDHVIVAASRAQSMVDMGLV